MVTCELWGAGREGAARAAVAAVALRDLHRDPEGAESDASHERTLQSEQLVEYRGDAHSVSCGVRVLANHEVPRVSGALPSSSRGAG